MQGSQHLSVQVLPPRPHQLPEFRVPGSWDSRGGAGSGTRLRRASEVAAQLRLRFLLRLREVSPSADETRGRCHPCGPYVFMFKRGRPFPGRRALIPSGGLGLMSTPSAPLLPCPFPREPQRSWSDVRRFILAAPSGRQGRGALPRALLGAQLVSSAHRLQTRGSKRAGGAHPARQRRSLC